MNAHATLGGPPVRAGALEITPLVHPQGCRGYLVADRASGEALALDVTLDQQALALAWVEQQGLRLRWVVDSHTHADHASAALGLARAAGAARVAHEAGGHRRVARRIGEGDRLELGDQGLGARDAPGHTPDHLVLEAPGVVFSGDSLLIGAVARADFLGGDAGALYDTLDRVFSPLPGATLLFPGHDYAGRTQSTLEAERRSNPWLALDDRDRFVRALEANPPPEPANMAALLRFNLEDAPLPAAVTAAEAVALVAAGGAGSVIDVRTPEEVAAAHVPGSRHLELETLLARADEVARTPAPRLLLCHTGRRAEWARERLARLGLGALCVVAGGIVAYARAGGAVEGGALAAPLAGGGCCAAPPPPQ